MKKSIILFILVISFVPFTARAGKMVFLIGGMSPPLVYEDNGKILGTDVEVVKEFCRQNNIIPEFKVFPWKRALKSLKDGDAHGMFSLFKTEEREKIMFYPSAPINRVRTVVIARKKDGIKISGLDDLKDKKIGVINGYTYGYEFDSLTNLSKMFLKDKQRLICLLDNERVDVILDSESIFHFNCNKYGFDRNKFETVYLVKDNPLYIAFSKAALKRKGARLAKQFTLFLNKLEEKGALDGIRNRYHYTH